MIESREKLTLTERIRWPVRRQRSLHGVEFVVSDDHAGLRRAIQEALPEGRKRAACSLQRLVARQPLSSQNESLAEIDG